MKEALVITGPTASGKTDISLRLAKKLGGEIVACDSMQVYIGMDIGTAKATKEERDRIPHHMIDLVEVYEEYDVVNYKKDASLVIDDILSRGKKPILVGGTGLYLNALVKNIKFSSQPHDSKLRDSLYAYEKAEGPIKLHEKLEELDPKASKKIHPNNVKRVARALELVILTGQSQETRNILSLEEKSKIAYKVYAIDTDRDILYERIDKRVDLMIEKGLVEEVEALIKSCKKMSVSALQAIGYKEIIEYLEERISLEEATNLIKQNTRHYAKRQITWFKKHPWVTWISLSDLEKEYGL